LGWPQYQCGRFFAVSRLTEEVVLWTELLKKMDKNGEKVLDFSHQTAYYTNACLQPQFALLDGTGVRLTR
jgi:hypothetical protein